MNRIVLALFVLCCSMTVVNAESSVKVKNENGVVSVSGETAEGTSVRITVKSTDDDSGYYAIWETVSDGSFSTKFTLRDRTNAAEINRYILTVKGEDTVTKIF